MQIPLAEVRALAGCDVTLSEPAAADRRGIGFGWLQNAWLLHARLKIHRGGLAPGSVASRSTENTRAGSLSWVAGIDYQGGRSCPKTIATGQWRMAPNWRYEV
jgi:hypothetical protein